MSSVDGTRKKKTQRGTIQKILHVTLASDKSGVFVCSDEAEQGYGLVRGKDGQQFFFDDTVVKGMGFADLHSGQEVIFCVENGPLRRVNYIRLLERKQ
jgi:cold shock CspA family protein